MAENPFRRYKLRAVLIGSVALAIAILGMAAGLASTIESRTLDWRFQTRPDQPQSSQIVHIDIDDKSIQEIGYWPWRREVHAEAIRTLAAAGAKRIVIDIEFLDPQEIERADEGEIEKIHSCINQLSVPDEKLRAAAATTLGTLGIKARPFLEKARSDPSIRELCDGIIDSIDNSDEALRGALKESVEAGAVPYLPIGFRGQLVGVPSPNIASTSSYEIRGQVDAVEPRGIVAPLRKFAEIAGGFGVVDVGESDEDGIYRRVPAFVKYEGRVYLQFGLKVAFDQLGIGPKDVQFAPGFIRAKELTIPTDARGRLLVNWCTTGKDAFVRMFEHLSFSELRKVAPLLRKDKPEEEPLFQSLKKVVSGKIVFICSNARSAADFKSTSIGAQVAGGSIHSNVTNMVLQNRFIREVGSTGAIGIMAALGLVAIGLGTVLRPFWVVVTLGALLAVYAGVAWAAFSSSSLVLPVVGPSAAVLLPLLSIVPYRFATEEKIKKQIKDIFGKTLDPTIVEDLLRQPQIIMGAGKRVRTTVMFTDIEGFSLFAERTRPEEAVEELNAYLKSLTSTILYYGGFVNKYLGDGTMTIFGIRPGLQPQVAAKVACRAAIEIQHKMKEDSRFHFGRTRIGICSGEVITGWFGDKHLEWTAVGDVVNLASRLQSLNKETGTVVLADEGTYQLAKDEFEFKPLGLHTVHGRKEPVNIYSLS